MPSILKREFAPISDQAWSQIDAEASAHLKNNLIARRVVDFSGPHGWQFAAVNLGTLKVSAKKGKEGVSWGTREVLPIIETRQPVTLKQMELDNFTRGSEDVDLDPLQEAVVQAARFEDEAVFNGFAEGHIDGLVGSTEHKALKLPKDPAGYPKVIAQAVQAMRGVSVGGPYAVVLNSDLYYDLMGENKTGYPTHRLVSDIATGGLHSSPAVKGGLVISLRGGDFELSVGKDFSIGYASHDRENVELFVTESFTFRVIEGRAVVALNPAS